MLEGVVNLLSNIFPHQPEDKRKRKKSAGNPGWRLPAQCVEESLLLCLLTLLLLKGKYGRPAMRAAALAGGGRLVIGWAR